MEGVDISSFLCRGKEAKQLSDFVAMVRSKSRDPSKSVGMVVTGPPGSGKTTLVLRVLRAIGCDPVVMGAGSTRTKEEVEAIASATTSTRGVLSMFTGPGKPIVTVLDEVESLGSGNEKGAMSALVKLVRAKKTKKQACEPRASTPVVCIAQSAQDKKTLDLVKSCAHIHLTAPTCHQIETIVHHCYSGASGHLVRRAAEWTEGNLHRLRLLLRVAQAGGNIENILVSKAFPGSPEDCTEAKRVASRIIRAPHVPHQHAEVVPEGERTVVSLLWHENAPEVLRGLPPAAAIMAYRSVLDVYAEADQLDKITFQRQAWRLADLSSLLKNWLSLENVRAEVPASAMSKLANAPLRFTRILTKYSTEHSNAQFLALLCGRTGLTRLRLLDAWAKRKDLGLSHLEASRLERYTSL